MEKDILFLLPPGFIGRERREYCPECAEMWGVLSYYPGLTPALDIRYVDIEHPRAPIVSYLGDGKHNAPTLILAPQSPRETTADIKHANGCDYIDSARQIGLYFAERFGTPHPRGV